MQQKKKIKESNQKNKSKTVLGKKFNTENYW